MLQDLGYPHSHSQQFKDAIDAMVESAPFKLQEQWWKAKPKALIQFETDVAAGKKTWADYNASGMKTGGGDLCYVATLLRHANPKVMDQLVELAEKWERGEIATSRAKGLNLVGKKSVTKSARAATGRAVTKFNLQTVYKTLLSLKVPDQTELLDAAIHDVRSWDETKKVCVCV